MYAEHPSPEQPAGNKVAYKSGIFFLGTTVWQQSLSTASNEPPAGNRAAFKSLNKIHERLRTEIAWRASIKDLMTESV